MKPEFKDGDTLYYRDENGRWTETVAGENYDIDGTLLAEGLEVAYQLALTKEAMKLALATDGNRFAHFLLRVVNRWLK